MELSPVSTPASLTLCYEQYLLDSQYHSLIQQKNNQAKKQTLKNSTLNLDISLLLAMWIGSQKLFSITDGWRKGAGTMARREVKEEVDKGRGEIRPFCQEQ